MTKVHLTSGDVVSIDGAGPGDAKVYTSVDLLEIMEGDESSYMVRWSAVDYVEAY